jgi:phosphoglycolate phosphatase-like HAD superfamily hydrolase
MLNACPEPGIAEVLRDLRCDAELMLLSNNKDNHIESVLQRLGLKCFFKEIAGRGSVAEIKPSPAGYLRLKNLRPDLTAADFLAVGDAVIDIAAATAAGIPFAAYNGGREENWRQCPFKPALYLRKWDAHACAELKKLLFAT